MSARVLRQRKGVRYAEDSPRDVDLLLGDASSPSPPRPRSSTGRRSKRVKSAEADVSDQPPEAPVEEAAEEEQKQPPTSASAEQSTQPVLSEESKEQGAPSDAEAEVAERSPVEAEDDEADEEWKEGEEEAPRRGGQGAKEQPPRDDLIVVDDDEEVNQLFSLPAPSLSLTHRKQQRGMLGGAQRKRKQPPARASKPNLLDAAKPLSAPPPPPPPSTSQRVERLPVTVSKAEAILLEDSLESLPSSSRPRPLPSSSPSTASRPPFSFTLPQTHKRKAPAAAAPPAHHSAASSASFATQSDALAAMRAVLGPTLPDSTLHQFLVAANYNCERALANILDSPSLPSLLHNGNSSSFSSPSSSSASASASAAPLSADSATSPGDAEREKEPLAGAESTTQDLNDDLDEDHPDPPSTRPRSSGVATTEQDSDAEADAAPIICWSRKLLVVLRVEAGCTTEGLRVVSEGDSITFRDQTRDTYHLRQLRQQQMQGSRRHAKSLRREIRVERKKEHRILRFVPTSQINALEIGTLRRSVSDVLVPLFDRKLIDLTAVVASPCPIHFDLLTSIPLLLSVWALPALFTLKREVHVERKGFMGRVVADAADGQLNPVDTFLHLLDAFRIEPTASSMKEEGRWCSPLPSTPSTLALCLPLTAVFRCLPVCCRA